MSNNKLKGKLIVIMDKQQVTDTFAKREFVIETAGEYPEVVKFELTQAKCEDIDKHQLGNEITVHFNCRGRKWTNKQGKDVYFVSLNAWRIEAEAAQEGNADDYNPLEGNEEPLADSFADDLPF